MPASRSAGSGVPHPAQADLDALIQALLEAGVELIVVGGGAAVLHGAPITPRIWTSSIAVPPRMCDGSRTSSRRSMPPSAAADLRPSAELLAGRGQLNCPPT